MTYQLFSLFSVLWIILSLALGDHLVEFKNRFTDNPVLTERQKLRDVHQRSLTALESVIKNSRSIADAQKAIEESEWPSKILVIFVETETTPFKQVYSQQAWTGVTSFSKRGIGYGSMLVAAGKKDYVVLEGSAKTADRQMLSYSVYVEGAPSR